MQKGMVPVQIRRIFGIAVLLAITLVVFAFVNYRNAKKMMYHYLENEAVSIAFSYEAALRASEGDIDDHLELLLQDLKKKEHIAYISVINRDFKIIADFDRRRLGKITKDAAARDVLAWEKINSRLTKADGREVLEINVPLHIGKLDRKLAFKDTDPGKPRFHVLKIRIYTRHGDFLVQPAVIQFVLVAVMLVVAALLGIYQYRTLKNYFRLQEAGKQQEKLAAVGLVAAGVAHEIKNPLGAVKGFVQLLAENEATEEEKVVYFNAILKETGRLEGFLGQLLDFTRARPLNKTFFDPTELAGGVVNLLREEAMAKGVIIKEGYAAPKLQIWADRDQLKQVLVNLALNGIQAMPAGGELYLSVFADGNQVHIRVADRGMGLPAGDEEKIFQPFYTTKNKGVGLGLALSKQIIEAHGGTIEVQNRSDGGSEFTVIIPGEG